MVWWWALSLNLLPPWIPCLVTVSNHHTVPQSPTPLSPLMTLNHPLLVNNPTHLLLPLLLWGKKKQTLLHIPLHCVLYTAKASDPNSLTEPDSSPGKYQTSSMGSTTYSPGPSSVFNSPNHAPAEQHSTNWLDSPVLAATLPFHCTQCSQQTQPSLTVHLQFAFQIYCNHRNLANWPNHWQRDSSSRVYSI